MEEQSMAKVKLKGSKSLAITLILLISALVAFTAISLGVTGIYSMVKSMNVFLEEYETSGYKMELKSEIQAANAVIEGYYNKFKNGKLSEEEAKFEAKEAVRNMRYRDDKSGYIWIDSTDYTLVMHPILSEEEGTNRFELTDKNGVKIIQNIMKSAKSGGGYNEFYFTKSDGVTVAPKITYSYEFTPWGWVITTGNYIDDMEKEMAASKAELNENFQSMILFFFILSIVILIVALIIAAISGRKIVKNIKKVQINLKKTADGNLNFVTDEKLLKRADEIGIIARSVEEVKESLSNMIGNIKDTGNNLKNSSEKFNEKFQNITESIQNADEALEELAQRATRQASDTELANNKVEELEQVIGTEQDEVGKLGKTVSTMMGYSEEAFKSIETLYEITEVTTNAIKILYDQTNKNNESAVNINKAVEIIKGIAEETNLLSLNSSIEAARAGEAGKGFAVVAEEIRKLAEESSKSAEKIEKIVKNLVENVGLSANKMNEVSKNVENQQVSLEETRKSFNSLHEKIKMVEDTAKEINSHTDVLNSIKTIVANIVNDLAKTVEENAASTEETSASMQFLSNTIKECTNDTQTLVDLSNKQNKVIMKFKL